MLLAFALFLAFGAPVPSAQPASGGVSAPQVPNAEAGSPTTEQGVSALFSWADFDADGRLDLAAVGTDGTLRLLANAGEGRFDDATERLGLSGVGNAALALWADYDGDGRLDLLVVTAERSELFRGLEGGSFELTELPLAGAAVPG